MQLFDDPYSAKYFATDDIAILFTPFFESLDNSNISSNSLGGNGNDGGAAGGRGGGGGVIVTTTTTATTTATTTNATNTHVHNSNTSNLVDKLLVMNNAKDVIVLFLSTWVGNQWLLS